MASLGSFSVDIRAGTATLQSDLGKAQRMFGMTSEQLKTTAVATGAAIGTALAAGLATATAAIKSAVDRMDTISKSASRIGIATEALSGLEFAARLSDVSIDQLSGGVLRLTKNVGEAAAGNKLLGQTFSAIGVATTNADGSLRKTETVLSEVAEVFAKLPDGAEKSKLAIDLFGRSGAQLIPLLNAGRDGLADMADEARSLGLVFDAEAGKQAEEFNDAITRVQAGLQGAATQIGIGLLPQLTEMAQVLQSEEFRNGFAAIVEGAANATIFVAGLVAEIGNLTRFVAEEAAARMNGPAFGDIARIEDAIARQQRDIADAQIYGGDPTSAIAELERLQLMLKDSVKFAEDAAAAELARGDAHREAAQGASETTSSGQELLDALRRLREEQLAEQEAAARAAESRRASAQAAREAQRAVEAATRSAADAQSRAVAATGGLNNLLRQQAGIMGGPVVQASQAYERELEMIAQLEADMMAIGPLTLQQQQALATARENANAIWVQDLEDISEAMDEAGRALDYLMEGMTDTPMQRMISDAKLLGDALEEAFAGNGKYSVEELQGALGEVQHAMNVAMIQASQEGLRSLQSMTSNGSKAFAAFQVAIDALSLAQAISAVLNQGQGDPYTAFARMAAMAAAVAQLVGNIGANFGGGFTDTAAQRQATQGTGTVLGDAEAKSESIQNALDITADATSELVGINRGMLRALQSLQGGLESAGGMLARGAGATNFEWARDTELNEIGWGRFLSRLGDPIFGTGLLGRFLGGSSQVTDQGLAISGGSLSSVGVSAYEEQQYRRWRFGSRRTREQFAPVGEEFESQFQLVINSIVDTVREGAFALGLLPADIEAALEAFRLEEIRISLKDLSADEQQAELMAVFSSIFDDLAGEVVPFIEQFQRVGEGLGETLVRVATGVQVTQEGLTRLGFSLDELDPERFAQISEALIDAAGGLESFISGMQSFVDKFAPEAHRFEILQNDITRAFEQYGLTIPATRDGMWELMQSMDATTETGREQIAMLLRLSDTADAYYTMLERAETERVESFDQDAAWQYAEAVSQLNRQLAEAEGASEFQLSLQDIARQYNANVARLNDLAQASGLAAAREEDLARALQVSTMQRMRAIAALEAEGRALVESLGFGPLGLIDQQIADLESQESRAAQSFQEFGQAIEEVAERATNAVDLLLGDLSPLRDMEKLSIALQGLRAGNVSQEQVLEIGRRLYGSGRDYNQLFDLVSSIRPSRSGGADPVMSSPVQQQTISPEMQALLDRRAEIEAEQRASQRFMEASELAQIIADLAGSRGEDFEAVARSLGLTGLDQLLTDLRIKDVDALQSYLTALQADSYSLEDLAATVTAGEQLIVDTLRDIFRAETFGEMLAKPLITSDAEKKMQSDHQIEAIDRIPESFDSAIEPVQGELEQLRELMAELIARVGQVASNTGRAADAAESQAETTATVALTETANTRRSNRIGAGSALAKGT